MTRAGFAHADRLAEKEIVKGVHLKIVPGDKLMLSIVRFEPHSTVPTHTHPHEQLGMVLEGQLEMWIGGERRIITEGETYVISPNVPHGAGTHEGPCLVLDAFHPLREEYLKLFAPS